MNLIKNKKTHNFNKKRTISTDAGQKLHIILTYIGMVIGIVSLIYIIYLILPDFIRFLFNGLLKIIKMDYPNL